MKKKLATLDLKVQLAGVGFALVLVAVVGYMLVVSPLHAEATKLQVQVDDQQTQIYKRRAELKGGQHPPTIQVADLFRLARAMPDREDMPGIILTLSQVARAAGVSFNLIEPSSSPSAAAAGNGYTTRRIHLIFNGSFYGLSDFLYRLRSLVAVHDGTLDANGRLFNVDQVSFSVQGNTFPTIAAEIYVTAYIYTSATPAGAAAAGAAPTTSTTSTTTTNTPASPPAGATASGSGP